MQCGVLAGHWLSCVHCTHRSRPAVVRQWGVVPVQLESAVHCTHREVVASQTGVAAGHCESAVQPAPHV
jgi:hypothetical protein